MLIGLCLWPAIHLAQSPQPSANTPIAVVAELDGIIHPIAAEYVDQAITQADTSGADVVVIVLRTPGGLLDSTRDIVSRMIASRAPVVVFVGPSGARAASAGFILTIAADVAVMAPGTHIGAAHPVSGTGQPTDTTMATKAAEDVAAYVRTLAEARKRNVDTCRRSGDEEPRVHGYRSARRLAAPDRFRRAGRARSAADTRRPERSGGSTAGLSTFERPMPSFRRSR